MKLRTGLALFYFPTQTLCDKLSPPSTDDDDDDDNNNDHINEVNLTWLIISLKQLIST